MVQNASLLLGPKISEPNIVSNGKSYVYVRGWGGFFAGEIGDSIGALRDSVLGKDMVNWSLQSAVCISKDWMVTCLVVVDSSNASASQRCHG